MITTVGEQDLPDLLPLLRAYCDFYMTSPADSALLAMARALIHDPREGTQIIAREEGQALGFATLFWSWNTTIAARIAIMHDLFVAPAARGTGLADRLIAECARLAGDRGCENLTWTTAPDNLRAQAVYERTGADRQTWVEFVLPVAGRRDTVKR